MADVIDDLGLRDPPRLAPLGGRPREPRSPCGPTPQLGHRRALTSFTPGGIRRGDRRRAGLVDPDGAAALPEGIPCPILVGRLRRPPNSNSSGGACAVWRLRSRRRGCGGRARLLPSSALANRARAQRTATAASSSTGARSPRPRWLQSAVRGASPGLCGPSDTSASPARATRPRSSANPVSGHRPGLKPRSLNSSRRRRHSLVPGGAVPVGTCRLVLAKREGRTRAPVGRAGRLFRQRASTGSVVLHAHGSPATVGDRLVVLLSCVSFEHPLFLPRRPSADAVQHGEGARDLGTVEWLVQWIEVHVGPPVARRLSCSARTVGRRAHLVRRHLTQLGRKHGGPRES